MTLFRGKFEGVRRDGPLNPEKALPVPALIERYDKKEGLLTTKSRSEAIGKYRRKITV